MKIWQNQFIKFCLNKGVLKFGDFILKSGRKSPYFFNTGLLNTGKDLAQLGRFYAQVLIDKNIEFDLLFGPAYKGIPIATTTAIALANHYNLDISVCFNRKESKKYGEGGIIVGSIVKEDKVVLVDDVITSGITFRESIDVINKYNATLICGIIAFDRQEHGLGKLSALQEVEQDYQCKIDALITLNDLVYYLGLDPMRIKYLKKLLSYREKYGI